jgi:hypothetical protein
MSRRSNGPSFYLTFAVPLIHVLLCVAIEALEVDGGWIFLAWIDFPIGLFLFGEVFQAGRPLFWFGIFGTLWWYLVSWAVWAAWTLLHERRTTVGGQAAPAEAAQPENADTKAQSSPTAKK